MTHEENIINGMLRDLHKFDPDRFISQDFPESKTQSFQRRDAAGYVLKFTFWFQGITKWRDISLGLPLVIDLIRTAPMNGGPGDQAFEFGIFNHGLLAIGEMTRRAPSPPGLEDQGGEGVLELDDGSMVTTF